jgi:hypothetical protein
MHDLWFGMMTGMFMGFWIGTGFYVSFMPGRWCRKP